MLEVIKESRKGIYLTIEEVAPHGEEAVEVVIKDEAFYKPGDMMIPARSDSDSGVDMRQGPSGPGPQPDDERKDQDANKENQGDDEPMEVKGDKVSKIDLRLLERDLLENDFNEAKDGGADESLMLITPSSFMSPTKEPSAILSPLESMTLWRHIREETRRSCSANLLGGRGLMNQCE